MRILCLSFIHSWTYWDRILSHILLQIQSPDCYKHTATSIQALMLFLDDQQKSFSGFSSCLAFEYDKCPKVIKSLKDVILGFAWKKISKQKSFWSFKYAGVPFVPNRVMSYSPLSSSTFSFISPCTEYTRKIISSVLTNSGILITWPNIFFSDFFFSICSQIVMT